MHEQKAPQKAVIYCRAVAERPTVRGSSTEAQEARCRDYASRQGYHITAVFRDDEAGPIGQLSAIKALLGHLLARKGTSLVLVDDISCLARDVHMAQQLRWLIHLAGAAVVPCRNLLQGLDRSVSRIPADF